MGVDDHNGRTHEPNLREVTAELDGLKNLMESEIQRVEDVMDERHALYKERSESAQKAASKTEQAQDQYNKAHNDLLRKMDDQHKETLPREEANAKFESISKEIQGLRESRVELNSSSQQSARDLLDAQRRKTNSDRTALAIVGILITMVIAGLNFLTRTNPATPTPATVVQSPSGR